ncbi:autotransporter-associated beta strand repeat-containing protein [Polynucleobacter sp. MWH-Spelu-300-X4]|uniref:autotransporter-associated beta strand repeat-containing protein n=1 Tax=Polynucleobacter sp. MWH-Spelu-300-X4 TaxID=2689109 RepID=UPI001BFE82A6|nr:autotransporter-associated beta strand repeat-containing protein [Polynucleobacter sp. MWH-Spelu-300-X4]QWD79425.1 autotransporter-associated beta strand repeat-containing protein [Polynucleobacter sp. MWH-Spelu-300-X4]
MYKLPRLTLRSRLVKQLHQVLLIFNAGTQTGAVTIGGSVNAANVQTASTNFAVKIGQTVASGTSNIGANTTLNNIGGFIMGTAANAHNLSVTGSFATAATGTAKLSGGVTTTTTQTYAGPVQLTGDTTFTTTNSAVTFSGAVDGTTANTESLTVAAGTGNTTFTGAVGVTTSLKNISVTTGALTAAAIKADTGITVTNTAASTISGIISGTASLTKAGASTLTLSGANTYSGTTAINAGTLISANTSGTSIDDSSAVTVASGATLDLRYAETLGSLAGAGTITTGTAGAKTLTVGGLNTDTTFSGVIQNGSGSLLLTKSGTGTTTLTGTNTYTGATVVNGGSLVFENNVPSITSSGFSGAGTLVIQSAGASFTGAYTFSVPTTSLGGLTIGKSGNTANITISAAQSVAGAVKIYGANIAINAALTATGANTIWLYGSGSVNGTGAITADKLALMGGAVSLTTVTNNVATLAAQDISSLSYVDSNALTVGVVNPTGIVATGAIRISTVTGDLTVSENISTTDTTSSAIVLIAASGAAAGTSTGGNVTIASGKTITAGTNGRIVIYTGSVNDSAGVTDYVGSGSGNFRYNAKEGTAGRTALGASGKYAIYREAIAVTMSTSSATMTYGDSLSSITGSVSGLVNGDSPIYAISNRVNSTSGNIKVGTYSLTDGGMAALGYTVTATNGTLTVNQKTISISGFTVADKTYDGTTTATVTNSGTVSGQITNDLVSVSSVTAAFGDKHAGQNKTLTISGGTLTGADSANYTASISGSATATITAKAVTLTAPSITKAYDGLLTYTTQAADRAAIASALVGGDTISAITLVYSDKNVGTSKTVTPSSVTISDGNNGNNYTVTYAAANSGTVTRQASVTWIGGVAGDWFNPANWAVTGTSAAGAIPDLSNVSAVVIPSGSTVTFNDSVAGRSGTAQTGTVNITTLTGGSLEVTNGALSTTSVNVTNLNTSSGTTLTASTGYTVAPVSGDTLTVAGVLAGGSLIKNGAGTILLAGANTYTGVTTINAGTLIVERDILTYTSSSYTGAGTLWVRSAASSFASAYTFNAPISSLGSLIIGQTTNATAVTLPNAITLTGSLLVYGPTTLGGNIATGSTQEYTGNVTISATNISLSTTDSAITFGGNVNGTSAGANNLFMLSGSGAINVAGNVGGTYALNYFGLGGTGQYVAGSTSNFTYTGAVQTYTAASAGTYTFYVWGASGGNAAANSASVFGNGGYASGTYTLTAGQTISIYVGGQGGSVAGTAGTAGGWNGGGRGGSMNGGSGGGATDIRIGGTALSNRVIVAGGGGGADNGGAGGAGGGLTGISSSAGGGVEATGGSQVSGGTASSSNGYTGTAGSLGVGGDNAVYSGSYEHGGGGGGGYYGGGGGTPWNGGGGGSSYVGGVTGGVTIAGNATQTSTGGGTQTGQVGNGYARVVFGNGVGGTSFNAGTQTGAVTIGGSVNAANVQTASTNFAVKIGQTVASGTSNIGANTTLNNIGGFIMGTAANAHNLSVTGSFATAATGTAKLSGGVTTTTTQTYAGPVQLTGDTTFTTTNSAVTFSGAVDGTTANTESLTVAAGTGNTTFTGAVGVTTSLKNISVTTGALTAAAIKADTGITVTNTAASTISGIISGTASLTKAGASTLTLSGANTYSGTTAINAGTLSVTGSLNDATAVAVASGAIYNLGASDTIASIAGAGSINLNSYTLTVGDATNTTYSGVMSGIGALVKQGSGALTMSGANTYSGATTINAGQIIIENDAPSFSTSGFSGVGSLVIQPASTSFTTAYTFSKAISSLGGLTIGKDGNTRDITMSAVETIAGPISIYGGAITINAALTATGSTITLKGAGAITDGANGYVVASNLLLLGGSVTLDNNTNNAIGTLVASGVSTLTYADKDALTIGTVGATNGVSTSGAINISTYTGDLTIAKQVVTADTSSSAIILNAGTSTAAGTSTGGNVIINGGVAVSTSVQTLASNSFNSHIWINSADYSGDLVADYSANSSGWTYAGETITSVAVNNTFGAGYVVTVAQMPTVYNTQSYALVSPSTMPAITAGTNGRVVIYTGSVNGSAGVTSYVGSATGNFRYKSKVGTNNFTTALGASGKYAIYREAIAVTMSTSSATMTYGDSLSSITGSVSGLVNGDSPIYAISNRVNSTSGNIKVGTYSLTDGGMAALGYTVTATNGTLTVNQKTISISGFTVADKTYDGTTTATVTNSGTVSGQITNDLVSVSSVTAAFGDKHAGQNKTLTISGGTLTGADSANYTASISGSATATITAKAVTLTAPAITKTYDGGLTYTTTAANLTALSSQLGVSGDTVTAATLAFTNKNAGTANKTVTTSSATISDGNSGNNYSITYADNTASTINKATVSLSAAKTYDGTTTLGAGTVTIVTGVGLETLTYTGAVANNANVAAASKYISAITLSDATDSSGGLTSNYQLPTLNAANAPVTISARALTITANNDSKTYGTAKTYGAGSTAFTSTGLQNSETIGSVTITDTNGGGLATANAGGTYALTPSVATGGTFTTSNYSITYTAGGLTVNKYTISINAPNVTKVYDGSLAYAASSADLTAMSAGLKNGDTITAATITYANKNVSAGDKVVTLDAVTLVNSNNYQVTLVGNSASTITRQSSVTWVGGATGEWFNPANWALTSNNNVTGVVPDLSNVQAVIIPSGTTVTFNPSVRSGLAEAGTVNITTLTGGSLNLTAGALSATSVNLIDLNTSSGTTFTASTGLTVAPTSGTSLTIAGVLAGTGSLTKNGAGSATLSGANTYTGGTIINVGILALGASDAMADVGEINVAGGTLAMGAYNDTVGTVTLSSGSIIGTTGQLISANYNVTNASGTTNISAILAGSGQLIKTGAGTLTLSSVNAYTGATVITAGTVILSGDGSVATSSKVTATGTLDISATTAGASIMALAGAGNVTLGAKTLTITAANDAFSGVIAGTGGLTVSGGVQTLSGVNTYSGLTTVNQGATLVLGAAGTIENSALLNNGTLDVTAKTGLGPNLVTDSFVSTSNWATNGAGFGTYSATSTNTVAFYNGELIFSYPANVSVYKTIALADVYTALTLSVNGKQNATFAGRAGKITIEAYDASNTLIGTNSTQFTTTTTLTNYSVTLNLTGVATSAKITFTDVNGNNWGGNYGVNFSHPSLVGVGSSVTNIVSLSGNGQVSLGSSTLNVTNAFETYAGVIAGTGGFKVGGGTQTLSGTNTYTGGTTINAGTLALGASNVLADAGALNVAGGTFDVASFNDTVGNVTLSSGSISGTTGQLTSANYNVTNATGITTISAILAGSGQLTKSGAGTLTLSATNTYTGATAINGGTLSVTGSLSDSTSVAVASGATYALGASDTITSLSGAGSINLNSYTLTVGDANNTTISGVISGNGGALVKRGSGSLTLSGANTYTGTTSVNAGRLIATNSSALGTTAGGTTVAAGATLDLQNVAIGAEQITLAGGTLTDVTSSLAGDIILTANSNLGATNAGDTLTLSGVISGSYGITKIGAGTVVLSGANTYTGATAINGGTLSVTGSLSDSTSVAVASGATYALGASDTITSLSGAGNTALGANTLTLTNANGTYSGVMSGTGGLTLTTGSLTLGGANTYTGATAINGGTLSVTGSLSDSTSVAVASGATYALGASDTITSLSGAGAVNLNGNTLTLANANGTYSGVMSGTGGLTLTTGSLTLGGANTYTGATAINGGTLSVTGSLSDSTSVAVASGATYALGASDTITSLSGAGAVNLNGNTLTLANANGTYSGVMSGTGGLTLTTGSLTLGGANTYTGATAINGGTLSVTGSLSDSTSVAVASGATYALGASDTITSLSGAGAVNLNGNTLTLANANGTYSGVMSGTGGLTLTTGSLTLGGANTYTGATAINGGTLSVTGSLSDSTSVAVASGATYALGASDTITSLSGAGAVNLNGNTLTLANANGTYSGVMSGTGGLTLTTGSLTLGGANTYTGATAINGGTLSVTGSLSDSTSVAVASGATYALGASDTITSLSGAGAVNLNGNTLTLANANGTYSGVMSGTGGLTLTTGSLTLGGANTYTGATAINGGTLSVTGSLSDSTSVAVASGATYALGASDTITSLSGAGAVNLNGNTLTLANANGTYSGVMSGTGGLTLTTGSLTLGGANTYTGATAINGGTLSVTGSLSDSTSVAVASGATYALGASDTITSLSGAGNTALGANTLTLTNANGTYSGVMSGTGGLTLTTGSLTLGGANTYTGATAINGGTLSVTGSLSDSTSVAMAGSAVWDLRSIQTISSLVMTSGNSIVNTTGVPSGLTVIGTADINDIATYGSQTYNGTVTLRGGNVIGGNAPGTGPYMSGGTLNPVSLISNGGNITFNGTINAGLQSALYKRSLTIEAGAGSIVFNQTIGTRGTLAGIADGNIYEFTVKAQNIYINADIITNEIQSYLGHVWIGDNGSNGLFRTLLSEDPSVTFGNYEMTGGTVYAGGIDDATLNTHTLSVLAVSNWSGATDPVITFGNPIGATKALYSITAVTGIQDIASGKSFSDTPVNASQYAGTINIMANVTTASAQTYTSNNFTLGGSSSIANNNIVFTTNHADITFNIGLAPPAFALNNGTTSVTFTLGGSNVNTAAVTAMNAVGIRPQGLFDLKSINLGGSLHSAFNKVMSDVASNSSVTGDVEVGKFEQVNCDSSKSIDGSCDK